MHKRLLLSLVTALFAAGTGLAQQTGTVNDEMTLPSKILGEERKYAVYLPPDYDTSKRRYPVLYLLHGAGDDQTGWIQFGEVLNIADREINAGRATPMVIVMPDANQTHRGYTNHLTEDFRYEDYFIDEFIPHVEKQFRIKGEKRYRAVSGLSMGGNGSLVYALRHPDLFSAACPLSAYAGPLSKEALKKHRSAKDATDEQIDEYYKKYCILDLVKNMPDDKKTAVRWYIDCGDDDFLFEGNSLLHIAMRKNKIPHEYRVREGGHKWSYWRSALPSVLQFVSDGFHQH